MTQPYCPKCGRFLGSVQAQINDFQARIVSVEGFCKVHGAQDITEQGTWDPGCFFDEEGEVNAHKN